MNYLHIIILIITLLTFFKKKETFKDLPYHKRYHYSKLFRKNVEKLHKKGLYQQYPEYPGLYQQYQDNKHLYKKIGKPMNIAPPKTTCCDRCIVKKHKVGKTIFDPRYGDVGT